MWITKKYTFDKNTFSLNLKIDRRKKYLSIKPYDNFIMSQIKSLKQVRKNLGVSLTDFSALTQVDTSNLTKYENDKLTPPTKVIVAYHLMTKTKLKVLIKKYVDEVYDSLIDNINILMAQLRSEEEDDKNIVRADNLVLITQNVVATKNSYESE